MVELTGSPVFDSSELDVAPRFVRLELPLPGLVGSVVAGRIGIKLLFGAPPVGDELGERLVEANVPVFGGSFGCWLPDGEVVEGFNGLTGKVVAGESVELLERKSASGNPDDVAGF